MASVSEWPLEHLETQGKAEKSMANMRWSKYTTTKIFETSGISQKKHQTHSKTEGVGVTSVLKNVRTFNMFAPYTRWGRACSPQLLYLQIRSSKKSVTPVGCELWSTNLKIDMPTTELFLKAQSTTTTWHNTFTYTLQSIHTISCNI